MNTRLIHKDQRGVTLLELVIVVVLAGFVGTAITATAFQVFTFGTRLFNQMTAIRQVHQAGFWVSPDVMMAEPSKITYNASSGAFLVLGWTTPEGTEHEVTYIITQNGELRRSHKVTPDGEQPTTEVSVVAQYISRNSTRFVPVGAAYEFTVTADVGGQIEERKYEVKPRVGT